MKLPGETERAYMVRIFTTPIFTGDRPSQETVKTFFEGEMAMLVGSSKLGKKSVFGAGLGMGVNLGPPPISAQRKKVAGRPGHARTAAIWLEGWDRYKGVMPGVIADTLMMETYRAPGNAGRALYVWRDLRAVPVDHALVRLGDEGVAYVVPAWDLLQFLLDWDWSKVA